VNPLEQMLKPLTAVINRQIKAKTPARELCSELLGRVMALRVSSTALALYLLIDDGELRLSPDYDQEPDVVLSGSLFALARLVGPAGEDLIRDGEIELSGDAMLAARFQKLLRYGRPDLENELSALVGDTAAHGVGKFVRSVSAWSRGARSTMRQNVGEYLQEESRAVPTRDEVDAFRDHVGTLRDDVARVEARLRNLQSQFDSRDH